MIEAEQLPLHFEFRANQTFLDFFPGPNLELINHLQRSAAGEGEPFIYLWGQSGHGKSHLLQACCHEAHNRNLGTFYFDLIHLDRFDPSLTRGLDECDLVCFDNIDRLAGKTAWETAFFNFFNRHRDQGHRLIVSARVAPGALAVQLPDLKTRLNWGLALKIQPLEEQDRLAALIFRARQKGLEITPQVGRFLLTHSHRDLASLWRLLEKLDQASLSAQRRLTIPFLKKIIGKLHE
ncbi:MAG: DnaA regulatory inactivator Hda [Gammaproteobacteria bacterium]